MGKGSKIFVFLIAFLINHVYSFTSLHQTPSRSAAFLSTREQKSHSGRAGGGLVKKRAIIPQQLGDMIGDMAAVSVGAVAGALGRYQIGNLATRIIEKDQRLAPLTGWHTAAINIFGSFILGSLAGTPTLDTSVKPEITTGISPRMRLMAGVGFCGAFTTFSTFSVDIVGMLNSGKFVRAITYATVNNVGGVAAAFAGFNMAKRMIKK